MIYFLGDIHNDFNKLDEIKEHLTSSDTLIQVGDFGFNSQSIEILREVYFPDGYPCKVYVIDGNHEDFTFLNNEIVTGDVSEFHKNMFYVKRGTVLEIEDKLIGFLGGADSVNKRWAKALGRWYEEETITNEDIENLRKNIAGRQLDVLVTHAPPPEIIRENFSPLNLRYWELPKDWKDVSSILVGQAISEFNPKKVVCGHMHKSTKRNNVRILAINEVMTMKYL